MVDVLFIVLPFLLFSQIEVPTTTWSTILNTLLVVAFSTLTTLAITNILKPVFTRGDDRFKNIEERQTQAEKQRDEIRDKHEELKQMIWEQTRQIDKLHGKYEELMRVFQMAQSSYTEEKGYLKQIIEIITNQKK